MISRLALIKAGLAASFATSDVLTSVSAMAQADGIVPFAFRAPQDDLDDLKKRLVNTRWPEREPVQDWSQGVPFEKLRALVEYWRTDYDWRRCEAELNQFPQFKTAIDGLGIHFINVRSKHPDARPIILTHGWPSTVLLFKEVIAPLTDPTAHAGTVEDAFHVVVPSLPGFGFSDKPADRGWNAERTAKAWTVLMHRLGYTRYIAQGGDWGAHVTTALAQQRPPGLEAIHLNFAQTIPDVIPATLLPDQKRAMDAYKAFMANGFAYGQLQATRPQTIGFPLADSPVGQAAWIYDILNAGTGSTGTPETALTRDQILDEITLYWLTNSSASSARFYREQAQLLGKRNNPGRVDLPVGVSVFPNDLIPARSWADEVYPNLIYWNELDRGGHFASLEVPKLFTQEIRTFAQKVR